MSERAAALAAQFEQAVVELAATIEKLPDEKWTGARSGEGWSVAATAQHVSGQFPVEMEYITALAEGSDLPAYSWDDINGMNDSRAGKNSATGKAAVLSELRDGAASAAAYVRGLSDEQLDRSAPLPLAGGAEVTTQQLIEGGVLIDHVRGHMASILAAS